MYISQSELGVVVDNLAASCLHQERNSHTLVIIIIYMHMCVCNISRQIKLKTWQIYYVSEG